MQEQFSSAGGGAAGLVAGWPRTKNGYGTTNPATNGRIYAYPTDLFNTTLEKPSIGVDLSSNGNIIVSINNIQANAFYVVYFNGQPQGSYVPSLDQYGYYLEIGNFVMDVEYSIYVEATYVSYYESGPLMGSILSADKSERSATILFTPTWSKLPTSPIDMNLNYAYDFVDITRVPSSLYNTSSFLASSTYKEIFDGNTVYNPIPFQTSLAVSFYSAKVKLRARRIDGSNDLGFGGSIDFVFKDAEVTLDDPFSGSLYTSSQLTIDQVYNAKVAGLGYTNRNMSGDLANAIQYKLKREYTLAKQSLIKKIEQSIKSDFSVIFKSRDANFQFRDLINWDPRLTRDFQDFIIKYDGGIYMNCKMISTSSTQVNVANKPLYSLKSSKNRILKTGSSVTSIMLSNPQECAHFGFNVMNALANSADFYGSAPAQ